MEDELEDTGQVGMGKVSWTALAGFENILAETMTTDRKRTQPALWTRCELGETVPSTVPFSVPPTFLPGLTRAPP